MHTGCLPLVCVFSILSAQDKGESLFEWLAVIEGPSGTVYEGSTFFMDMFFSTHYPFVPPQLVFLTRIYHCNVNAQVQYVALVYSSL